MRAVWVQLVGVMTSGLLGVSAGMVPAQELEEGFVPLFDGQSLDGWRGYRHPMVPEGWGVDDGMIQGTGRGGDLMTVAEFTDFDFRFEWKIAPRGNSGVMYRVTEEGDHAYWTGPEYQILDDRALTRRVPPPIRTAALYGLYAAEGPETLLRAAGQFNEGRIVVVGNHVQHWLNGEKVVDATIGSEDWNKRVAASKFRQWPRFAHARSGHIVLQAHGSAVWFRNLRLKPLEDRDAD